jgi:hypothetical protein
MLSYELSSDEDALCAAATEPSLTSSFSISSIAFFESRIGAVAIDSPLIVLVILLTAIAQYGAERTGQISQLWILTGDLIGICGTVELSGGKIV